MTEHATLLMRSLYAANAMLATRISFMNETTRARRSCTKSAEDAEHVGLCAEFAALSWLAPTPEEAFARR